MYLKNAVLEMLEVLMTGWVSVYRRDRMGLGVQEGLQQEIKGQGRGKGGPCMSFYLRERSVQKFI